MDDEEEEGEGEIVVDGRGGMEPSIVSRSLENAIIHTLALIRGDFTISKGRREVEDELSRWRCGGKGED
jgi:hypothetical protein